MVGGKRRLQKLGGSLFVSLPREWTEKYGLESGNEVFLHAQGPELVVTPMPRGPSEKMTHVLIFSRYLYRELIREYLQGTDVIVVQKQSGFTKAERQQVILDSQRLMNTEVIEESSTKITLQHFRTENVPIKQLVQRMYFLTHSMLTDLQQTKEKNIYASIIERDMTVGKFYLNIISHLRAFLMGRQISKEFTLIELQYIRLLIERIERIGDDVKRLASEGLRGKKIPAAELAFLQKQYEQAFKAYWEKDLTIARSFWDNEEKDRQRFASNVNLLRLYDNIKDIADLVI